MKKSHTCWSIRNATAMVEMYSSGQTLEVIAQKLGCCIATVSNTLRREGVEMRGCGRPKVSLNPDVLAADYFKGKSLVQLGTLHGVSSSTALNALRRGGYKTRGRGRPRGSRFGKKLTIAQRDALDARILECRGTLMAIGREFDVSHEYVRQRAGALRCRYYLQKNYLSRLCSK